MNNFICPKCKKEFNIPVYTIKYKQDTEFFLKNKQLICDEDSEILIPIPKEGEFNTAYGKFTAMSPDQRQVSLRKRARAHGQKTFKEQNNDEK